MTTRPAISWKRHGLLLAAGLVIAVAAVVGFRLWMEPSTIPSPPPTIAQRYPGLNLEDPAAAFETLRYVADTGGDESTRAQAIVWLDEQTRNLLPLPVKQESWMLAMLTAGGHPKWDKQYKFWLFNSAFNTLHRGPHQEDLTRLLKHLAAHDPEKTMRLYALQHLEVQRTNGRLTGALADEVRVMFLQVAAAPDGQEAGLAIRFLAEWHGAESPVDPDVISQALEMAAANSRTVDVRVTALHAAGPAALQLARNLANDSKQPMLVRKAAIACIGQHGGESDTSDLQKLSSESSRLAQAADPALSAIRKRQTHPTASALIPF